MILSRKYKNKILLGLILGLLSCIWVACIEDKGNYDYRDVNSVQISGIKDTITAPLGQRLQITPTLHFSAGEAQDSFKYEWHVLGKYSFYSIGVISKERNLDFIVGDPITEEGSYRLMYCVTNMTTGVRYDYNFCLFVQDRMMNGYIMLCERENNSFDIDLISLFNDTLTQYHNVLDFYDSQLPRTGKPLDLACYCDPASPMIGSDGMKKYAIWVLTDKGTERVRVENFEWQPKFNISGISLIPDKYLQDGKLIAEKMSAVVPNSNAYGINYIYANGNWFWYNWPGSSVYFFLTPINASSSTSTPYKTAPYIYYYPGIAAVLFNEDEHRFEYQNANSSGASTATLRTSRFSAEQTYFNWENPDYRLMYMDKRGANNGFAVVKNVSSEKYELLLMGGSGLIPQKLGQAEFPEGLTLENIKFYAFHPSLPYLFCATEDKLYRINTTVMVQWEDVTSSILPSGHKISKVKNSAVRFPNANRIVIATYDPNGQAGKNGQLALYDVEDGTGNLILAKHPNEPTKDGYQIDMKWTGFGKIINVDYKEPK